MYTLDPEGIYVSGAAKGPGPYVEETKLIPYAEIKGDVTKLNLAEEIVTSWNLLKPGLSGEYLGVEGDPLHALMIETEEGRYLLRGNDMDDFLEQANAKLREWRAAHPAAS